MLAFVLAVILGLHGCAPPAAVSPPVVTHVDTAAIYSVLLRKVRDAYPGLPILLAETRSGVACMPHCGARFRGGAGGTEPPTSSQDHSPALIQLLRDRGLVQATCIVPERTFGCLGHPGELFIGLGEIQTAPPRGPLPVEGGVWVKVALLVPCETDCRTPAPGEPYFPDGFGLWFLLKPRADATWEVVGSEPAFAL